MGCSNWKFEFGKKERLTVMLVMTGSFMVTELIVGYIGGSLTLIADSFHMLSDVAALGVAFISITLSPKPWARCTFGWTRAEVLGALVNAVFLMSLAFSILVEALKRFLHPEPVTEPRWIFGVGICGLIINVIGLILFKDHAHAHSHSHEKSKSEKKSNLSSIEVPPDAVENRHKEKKILNGPQMNMRGVFLHLFADMMASVAVIFSATIVWVTEKLHTDKHVCYFIDLIDPALSVLICIIIVSTTWPLLYQASMILLQTLPANINADELKKELERIDGVTSIHELHVWQLTGNKIYASAHLKCHDITEYDRILMETKIIFTSHSIEFTTIQAEFNNETFVIPPGYCKETNNGNCLISPDRIIYV